MRINSPYCANHHWQNKQKETQLGEEKEYSCTFGAHHAAKSGWHVTVFLQSNREKSSTVCGCYKVAQRRYALRSPSRQKAQTVFTLRLNVKTVCKHLYFERHEVYFLCRSDENMSPSAYDAHARLLPYR